MFGHGRAAICIVEGAKDERSRGAYIQRGFPDQQGPTRFGDPDTPIEINVLANDYDPLGGPLKVVDLGETENGGEAWIAPGGHSVFYVPPKGVANAEWGDAFILGQEQSPSNRSSDDVPGPGGITRFLDHFGYTIENAAGATASAFVQLQSPQDPKWELKHNNAFTKKQQVGIDGKAGYNLKVVQEVGLNPPAMLKQGVTEEWQKNTESSTLIVKLRTDGKWHAAKQDPRTVIDVLQKPSPALHIDDKLAAALPSPVVSTAFVFQDVTKKAGFNAQNKSLKNLPPVSEQQKPGKGPSADEIATVDAMQGPTLEMHTHYIFLDKKLLTDALNELANSGAVLDEIKKEIKDVTGMTYDQLPEVYERLIIDGLDDWSYP